MSESGSSDTNDETFDDWVENEIPCRSLFDDVDLPSVQDAINYDREKHNFDVNATLNKLGEHVVCRYSLK